MDKHMVGFEKEATLKKMFNHPDVRSRLRKWNHFEAVVKVINPSLLKGAFKRRPCKRTLRFIGYDNFDKSVCSEEFTSPYIYGNRYHSAHFNGATYTIKETKDIIEAAYFEVVEDVEVKKNRNINLVKEYHERNRKN